MPIVNKILNVSSHNRIELIDITLKISDIINREGFNSGIVNIFVKHTTCGVIINEPEKGLINDLINHLSKIVPFNSGYLHDRIDSNADAHIKSILISPSITIPIVNGSLALGTWQKIMFYELDGPRNRAVQLTFIVE
ncbi:MAG: secondary thiamine-phosphate synthase enzyme YjbQ [Candidatus Odinarchaeia archaeon]